MNTPRRKPPTPPTPEALKGVSPAAFGISVIFVLILTALVIVLMVLYFRRDQTLIKPSQCPEKLEGLLVQSDEIVTQATANCGSQVDCQFTVGSVQEAIALCENLGTEKCVAFSLTQVPNTDVYDMVVSDASTTSVSVGTDTYRILV